MIGAVVTILLYVTLENKQAFFYVGIASLCVKVAEFIIRLVP